MLRAVRVPPRGDVPAAGVRPGALARGVRGRALARDVRRGVLARGVPVEALDPDVRGARIRRERRQREVLSGLARDLEPRLVGADLDGADITTRDPTPAADERQQPAWIGVVLGAQVDAEQAAPLGELTARAARSGRARAGAGVRPRTVRRNSDRA